MAAFADGKPVATFSANASLMPAATVSAQPVVGRRLAVESLRGALLWLLAFAGAFVFIEPSPYELAGVITIMLFAMTGLTLAASLAPLVLLLILLTLGYATSVVQVSDQMRPVTWVLISAFLAATAIFYAGMLGANTERRLELLMRGYLAGALIAALVAIAAYFRLFGGASDMFVLYGRARGTFNDPNVLGAFLVLPGLLVFQRILAGHAVVRSGLMLLVMLAALLLSFSRGAWAQFVLAATVLMALTFVTSRSANERVRIVLLAALGVVVVVGFVAALLSIGQVADLFKERATLEQSYDIGRYGRFGRYLLGADLALEHPLGIGPLQFYRYFTEDPHNTFLNEFMSGGWLAGFCYLTLSAVTLVMGLRFVFVPTPWQPIYLAVYAAYVGVVAESVIIDINHWRHYFLILGVLWGLMAASRNYLAQARAEFRTA
jgi:O-Antigen ligase